MVRTLKLEKSQILLLEIEKFNKPKKKKSKVSASVVKFQLSPDRCMLHGKKIIPGSQKSKYGSTKDINHEVKNYVLNL